MTTSTTRPQPPPPAPDFVDREDVPGAAPEPPPGRPAPPPGLETIPSDEPAGRDAGAARPAEDSARDLLGALAAAAVRRDDRALAEPLIATTPWSHNLPPAAFRMFAADVRSALLRGGAAQQATLVEALRHWEDVARRFD